MELKKIISGIENLKSKGSLDIDILNICNNSKEVKAGDLFIAIKGFVSDGHEYIEDAIKNGAKAIMIDLNSNIKGLKIPENITVIIAQNTRHAASICAINFYKNPSKNFKLIGVTGTKGKTTTTFMIKSILEKQGRKVGLIGTIANYIGDKNLGNSERTTPENLDLQKLFAQMAKEKVEVVVMEVASQSIKLDRVAGLTFDIGIFTNFSKDHISDREHPDMEDYFNCKVKLFEMSKIGYINADDRNVAKVKKLVPECEIFTYGIDNNCDILAKDIIVTNSYVDFKVKIENRNERIKAGIPGRFSVYNSLASICIAGRLGCTANEIREGLIDIKVPGRSELVPNKKELNVMIDFAHTPESLENILTAVKAYTKGKVISVFGCGGDRDPSKRPIMGEVSGRIADFTIITSDNPRTEKPEEIVKQIEEGIKKGKGKYVCIVDRIEAIKYALKMANKIDMIVLAGKGHEPYQEIHGKKYPFDERIIVNDLLNQQD